MDHLSALSFTRRASLRARARCAARAYVQAATETQEAMNAARRSLDMRDLEPYHAALLSMAAKKDMFCSCLTELEIDGDDFYRQLHTETMEAIRAGCLAVDERWLRPFAEGESEGAEGDTLGVDQAPGWAFGGGSTDA